MSRTPWAQFGLVLVVVTAAPRAQQTVPSYRSNADGVVVDVTVRLGTASVTDLEASDFRVMDNGVEQTAHLASAQGVPLDLWILTNNSADISTERNDRARFPEQIRAVVALLRPSDRVAVMALAYPMRQIVPLGPLAPEDLPAIPMHGLSTLHDGIADALMIPGDAGRRHVIIAQVMGFDEDSGIDGRRLPQLAERSDAILYLVRTSAVYGRRDYMLDAARVTGGTAFKAKDITDAVRQTLAALTHSYVLTYNSTGVERRGWHTITVTVKRPGTFTVAARRGYFVQ